MDPRHARTILEEVAKDLRWVVDGGCAVAARDNALIQAAKTIERVASSLTPVPPPSADCEGCSRLREELAYAIEKIEQEQAHSRDLVMKHSKTRAATEWSEQVIEVDEDGKVHYPASSAPTREPGWREPNYVKLLAEARRRVDGSLLYKRFIEHTPLENDIAVWMADFASEQYPTPPRDERPQTELPQWCQVCRDTHRPSDPHVGEREG